MSISDLTDDSSANPITDSKMDEKKANDQVTDGPPLDEEVAGDMSEVEEVRKGLHSRHIQMIALAGTIGTGLFLSSGRAISRSGPLGALIGYLVTGAVAGVVTLSIAEMGALVPLNGGIVRYSGYWVDPGLSFANGWNLVYSYSVSMPAEIVAATVLVEFWITINSAIWITIFGVLMLLSGFCVIRIYGEMEFGFSLMKIALIVGVNLMALVITYGGGPNHEPIGFKYWKRPGPFVQYLGIDGSLGQFLGVWTAMNNALYAYSGIESITVAAAETRSPRRAIPNAAKRIFGLISIFMLGLVVPSDDPNLSHYSGTASTSPFVIAAKRAGIKVVPSVINAVIITSAWSSGNSNVLSGSRVLYGLAKDDLAPRIFTKLNRFSVPWVAITMYGVLMCLAYLTVSSTASIVFDWLQDLVSISTLVNWLTILVTYLRFFYGCEKQGISRKSLPWAVPFQPYISWASMILCILLLVTGGYVSFIHGHWSNESFVSSYINIPIFFILYFSYKYIKKTKIVALEDIPIRGFIDSYIQSPEPEAKPKSKLRKLNFLWS
ncbi:putative amino acid permease [Leptodontidium sp. MPI-SDFR-AT-0119]|nr:putative amino acid permease [Leptodontidium sp. MPI-SDFR-AT-0119]